MKHHQSRSVMPETTPAAPLSRRLDMNVAIRRLLIATLILIILAVAAAWLIAWRPLEFSLNRQTLSYQSEADFSYQVILHPETFGDRTALPMDQVYLSETIDTIKAELDYTIRTDRLVSWQSGHQVNAIVQIRDAANPEQVLLSRAVNLVPDQPIVHTPGEDLRISETVSVRYADYEAIAEDFVAPDGLELVYTLSLRLTVQAEVLLAGGETVLIEEPELLIPLLTPKLSITRPLPVDPAVWQTIDQTVRYQLRLTPLPLAVYLVVGGLALVLLVLLLVFTRGHRPSRFRRRLRKLIRQSRSQLMLIGDRAWEPEWCIRSTNFKSMARTARRLKHPIFCYVDDLREVAYFYVYYGENNYCYILGDHVSDLDAGDDHDDQLPGAPGGGRPDDDLMIPRLPDDDDSDGQEQALDDDRPLFDEQDQDNSPEQVLHRLRFAPERQR